MRDPETDAAIPAVGKLMMNMLVMALACDITPVGSLMWSDSEAKHTFPWLGLNETYSMPFLLAGGGGLRTGRYLQYDHAAHNDLLVALLNLFGDPRTTFGDVGSGALDQLT